MQDPPLYPGLPIVGSLLDFRGDRALLLRRAAERYGPIVRFAVGPRQITLVADPDLLGELLVRQHARYEKRTRAYEMMRDGLGNGLLTSDGPHWARQRKLAQPAFRREQLSSFVELILTRATELASTWARAETVDVVPAFHRLSMRIAGEAFLGQDVGPDADAIRTSFDRAIRLTTQRVISPWSPPLWVPTSTNRGLWQAFAEIDRILGAIVTARRDAREPGDDFLGRLLTARDEETGEGMSDTDLLDEVKTLFIAGFETVSNALSWSVYELGRNPSWWERVRAEAKVLDEHAHDLSLLERLPTARRVFQESMRRYPPIWATGRTPIVDEDLGGWRLPAGGWVFPSPYVVHHLPAHWPDPDVWDPDRFLPERVAERHPNAFLPFLVGPRRCIGEHFAMMEGVLILSALARGVRWTHRDGVVPPEPVVTLRPARPIRIDIGGA